MIWAVVPAAGSGRRFGGERPKQYADIHGKPLIGWTLQALAQHPAVAGLMVVLAADDLWWPGWTELAGKPVLRACGGAERADSVLAGLRALPPAVAAQEFVLVHDAARPCVRAEDISRLIDLAGAAEGGLLATPLRDTLKRADASPGAGATPQVAHTVAREGLWRALTPQMFRRGALEQALARWPHQSAPPTDEAQAMEACGVQPLLVAGADDNLKVTTPSDWLIASQLLGARQ
ncbi:MAG: 2-C-methyl-D-erythritol 4-phosphate cytidylyltransferase [Lysobacterales bacterium]